LDLDFFGVGFAGNGNFNFGKWLANFEVFLSADCVAKANNLFN